MGVALGGRVGHCAASGATLLHDVYQDRVEHRQQHQRQQDEHDGRKPVEHLREERSERGWEMHTENPQRKECEWVAIGMRWGGKR